MVLYSVTVNVVDEIHEEWLTWMREKHVPDVMNTGCFSMHKIMRLKEPKQDGHTYSFQYYCESHEKLKEYQTQYAPTLRDLIGAKTGRFAGLDVHVNGN